MASTIPRSFIRKDGTRPDAMRGAMMLPLVLLMASVVSSAFSYRSAKSLLAEDLNSALVTFASCNEDMWSRQDTIEALQHLKATIDRPVIYPASDLPFIHETLRREAYYSLALVSRHEPVAVRAGDGGIESDSIIILPRTATGDFAIRIKGFANCSMASVFCASDQSLPGTLLALSLLSFATLMIRRRREDLDSAGDGNINISDFRLTHMQRRLVDMLLSAPGHRVGKYDLCTALWGGKDNAEESLYTLVKSTKSALAETGAEIVCHRGDSYELRIKG